MTKNKEQILKLEKQILFGEKANRLLNKITIGLVSLVYILFIFSGADRIISNFEAKNAIINTPLLKEQKSDNGFKVALPSLNWRFLKKETSSKIFGNLVENADIALVDKTMKVWGFFIAEDLTDIEDQLSLDFMAQNLKKELIADYEIIIEEKK